MDTGTWRAIVYGVTQRAEHYLANKLQLSLLGREMYIEHNNHKTIINFNKVNMIYDNLIIISVCLKAYCDFCYLSLLSLHSNDSSK